MSAPDPPGEASTGAPESHLLNVQPTEMTAWVGWIAFAGVIMVLVGTFHAIQGLVALFEDEYFLVATSRLVIHVDYTAWGWIHLVLGIVVALTGFALFTGRAWARALGVVIVMVSAVVNVGFLAAYPIWSALMIALDVLVIWALVVHGAELES